MKESFLQPDELAPKDSGSVEAEVLDENQTEEKVVNKSKTSENEYSIEVEDLLDEEVEELWNSTFTKKPKEFFSTTNLSSLEDIDQKTRIALLSRSCLYLTVSTYDIEKYTVVFPEDLDAIYDYYIYTNGEVDTGIEFQLFATIAPLIQKRIDSQISDIESFLEYKKYRGGDAYRFTRFKNFGQHLEISERKERAEELLMHDYRPGVGLNSLFDEFGEAGKDIIKIFNEGADLQLGGKYQLDLTGIFKSEEYKSLTQESRAKLLKTALGEIQFLFIFEEVYNSNFSKQYFARTESENPGVIRHDVAHSYLYNTRQGSETYNTSQDFFNYEMNNTADSGGFVEEYAYHRICLEIINELANVEVEKKENTEYIVEFWNKNRNPIFANSITEALSSQNPNIAVKELMKLILEDETPNKNALAAILYRIELGKIGISEKGVKYLERIYDLGDLNDPNFFVNRLTGTGNIGIFNDEQKLIGFFSAGDVTDGQTEIRPEVLSFTYETLFYPKDKETDSEREERLEILKEFQENYFSFYGESFFEDTGVRFNNLSFKEQGAFMWFIKNADERDITETYDLLSKYGEDAMRSFIALNKDKYIGDKILQLAESLDTNGSTIFFKYCSNFSKVIQNVELMLNEKNIPEQKIRKIVDKYLSKMIDIIENALSYIEKEEKIDLKLILEHIDAITKDTILLEGLYSSGIDFDSSEKIELETIDSQKINEGDISDIQRTYRLRYSFESEKVKKHLDEHITTLLESKDSRIYAIRVGDTIRASIIIKDLGTDTVYAAGFHIDPIVDMPVGGKILSEVLEKERKNSHIVAEYDPREEKLGRIYKLLGFKEMGTFQIETGETLMKIILPKEGSSNDLDFAEPEYWNQYSSTPPQKDVDEIGQS
ncbi:hypothetical protein COW81_03005 [Candidatus Campbellbacteria bacterium CG22_combo_CG10-13_8_21_14_all_36_13]|uniref:N-acetyltransferase domain-containing protein n=1 Tax=Candidatus Campbellbacteria bacterium CG22_combo_CG10-13_8_21_14_all_36_13 TaxID=1974529 RepID=A0A2H0DXN3_9BACT|nr:MAG: hypothetical protein COW81_03005 [Candidatus Campbellbacteria bacterium CG22_combo_CG10-13_8_21_14_all_36_13]